MKQKCKICRTRMRQDGFCPRCRQYTGKREEKKFNFRDYSPDATQNKIDELTKQQLWLKSKVEMAKTPEKKAAAQKKLDDWWETHGSYIRWHKQRLEGIKEFVDQ